MIMGMFRLACVSAWLMWPVAASAQQPAPSPLAQPPQITVDGRAQELVEQDALRLTVGAETMGPSPIAAMNENVKRVARLVEVAKEHGVAAADMRTSRIDLGAAGGSQPKASLFRAANLVTITVRKVAEADPLVAALLTAGANRVHGIAPIVERNAECAARLRVKAIANARDVAEQSVKAAGARLGPVLTIRATSDDWSGFQFTGGGMRTSPQAAPVPIEEEMVAVSINVTVTWAILQ